MAVVLIIISLLCWLCYGNTLAWDFLHWDDTNYILQDPLVQQPSFINLVACWTSSRVGVWYPLARTSHLIDVWMFGNNVFAHRLENLLLHIINSSLVFLLCWQILKYTNANAIHADHTRPQKISALFSLFAAAIFAVHPQHIEVVVWLTQRNELLSTLFILLCLLSYFYYLEIPAYRKKFLYASGVFSVIAMTAKPTAVGTPVTLIFMDILFRQNCTPWQSIREKLPWILIAFAVCFLSVLTHHDAHAFYSHDLYNIWQRIIFAEHNIQNLLIHFFIPTNLTPFQQLPATMFSSHYRWIAALILVCAVLILLIAINSAITPKTFVKTPLLMLITLLLLLLPTSGIIIFGSYGAGNRYMYMPSALLTIFIMIGLQRLWLKRNFLLTSIICISMFTIPVTCLWLTNSQVKFWKDDLTLWNHVIELQPATAYPRFYRAIRLYEAGQIPPTEFANLVEASVTIEPILPALNALLLAYSERDDTPGMVHTHQRIAFYYPHHSSFSKAALAIYQLRGLLPGDGRQALLKAIGQDALLCSRLRIAQTKLISQGLPQIAIAIDEVLAEAATLQLCKPAP